MTAGRTPPGRWLALRGWYLFVSGNGWAVALTSDPKIHTLLGGEEAG